MLGVLHEKGSTSKPQSNSKDVAPKQEENEFRRDVRFWLIFGSLCCCSLLSALDLVRLGFLDSPPVYLSTYEH